MSQADLQTLVDQLAALDEDGIVTVITSVMQARPETSPSIVQFAVPDLTYPPQRALVERRSNGLVKSFHDQKGFGFIQCEELSAVFGNDIFVHTSQVPKTGEFVPGAPVNFAVVLNRENKPQAYDIQFKIPGSKGGKGESWGGESWGSTGGKGGYGAGGDDEDWASIMSFVKAMKGDKGKGKGKDDWGGKGWKGGKSGKSEGKGWKGESSGPRPSPSWIEDAEVLATHSGSIKSFNSASGYGFIECPEVKAEYGNDVFLHHGQLDGHEVGAVVQFDLILNANGKPQAKNLQGLGGQAPAKRQRTDEGAW